MRGPMANFEVTVRYRQNNVDNQNVFNCYHHRSNFVVSIILQHGA
jgi:hypothetical protein